MRIWHALANLVLGLSCIASNCDGQDVDFGTLLDEMVDRDDLPKVPIHDYRILQASSYDRQSVSPEEGWYANGDGGGFIRTETNQGRTERVLMDAEGPGCIVRFWSTYLTWQFSDGKLRFYFDGSETPQIEGRLTEILHGTHLVDGVLAQTTGGFLENNHILAGRNLYLPIPYASSCKVTYEGSDSPFYFAINYRKYADDVTVQTFSMDDLKQHEARLVETQQELENDASIVEGTCSISAQDVYIAAGNSHLSRIHGSQAIRLLALTLDAKDYQQALRSTVLEIRCDDKQTVWAPVGDFFGTGYQISQYETRYQKVTLDGRMLSRWVMPFQQAAEILIHNHGEQDITLKDFEVSHSPWIWDQRSLYFHASWRLYPEEPSAKGRDTNFVTLTGRGKYVGDSLAIFNGVSGNEHQPWWGEGDEKIYVDGEEFPSNFGTGTEDYYGYAWVGCTPFSHPFLAQPRAQGNRGRGLTVNNRVRALDAMPFHSSLKLDMEIWHWVDGVTVDYAPTTFWYATHESKRITNLYADSPAEQPNDLAATKRPVRRVDRIEAETMVVEQGQPGSVVVHTMPNDKKLSNRSYWLVRGLKVGDAVTGQFHVDAASTGTLQIAFVRSARSMTVDIFLNGELLLEGIDLNGSLAEPFLHEIPNFTIRKGKNDLTAVAVNASTKKPNANEIGVDFLQLLDH